MCRIMFFAPFALFAVKKIPFSAVSISDAAAETRHVVSLQKADMKKSPEFIPIYREGI